MSQSQPSRSYREMMERAEGSARDRLGDPLITVEPKHVDARTRHQSTMALATLATMSAWVAKNRVWKHPSGQEFDTRTLSGLMGAWQFNYEVLAPSLDGAARKEYVDVSKWVAVGGSDESAAFSQNILNEGSKNLTQGKTKTK